MKPGEHTAGVTKSELRVLSVLNEHWEPVFNGTLGALTGLAFDSVVFDRLEKRGLLIGHPYEITESGRTALAAARQEKE